MTYPPMVMPRPVGPFVSATSNSSTSCARSPGSSDIEDCAMGESESAPDDWAAFGELSCARLAFGVDATALALAACVSHTEMSTDTRTVQVVRSSTCAHYYEYSTVVYGSHSIDLKFSVVIC